MELLPIFGMVLCLVSSTLTPLGLILQKYSYKLQGYCSTKVAVYRQPWWLAGITVFLLGHVLNIISTGLAPQAILSCLGTWGIISNAVFAWIILKERVKPSQQLSMGGMAIGMIMVVLSAPQASASEQGNTSADELAVMFLARPVVLLVCTLVGMLTAFRAAIFQLQKGRVANTWAMFSVLMATVVSGAATTLCKCVSLLAAHSSPHIYLVTPAFYVLLAAGACLSVVMLRSINIALREGDALIVVPMYYALGMLSQILVAGVFFDEFNSFPNVGQVLIFVVGFVILLCCIAALPLAQLSRSPVNVDEYKETEEELLSMYE